MDIIPFDDRDGSIWYNGSLVAWRDCKVHVLNHGLHYASSVFEGIRAYEGTAFKLREHCERLHQSAELLGFTIPYSVDALCDATNETLRAQNVRDGYIRPVAFRGSERMTISSQNSSIHVAIACWAWPAYYEESLHEKGIRMTFADWKRPAPDTAPCASKAAGLYMICTLSKHKAEAAGFNDAMMLDWRGYLAEGSSANFFMVINGELHTPKADCFLNGITRRTIIDLAKARGITVVERHIKPEELADAQEAFLTGTAAEVTPVGEIDHYRFVPGEITKQLVADYKALVRTSHGG
jgi:branched-chain amino acid aminotransferase